MVTVKKKMLLLKLSGVFQADVLFILVYVGVSQTIFPANVPIKD